MCGRFTITKTIDEIENKFDAEFDEDFISNFNAAPSQYLPIINNDNSTIIKQFRWGLIPFWAKDEKIGHKLINARSETLSEKPSFREAYKKRRCLVITDGFYEWKKTEKGKQPYRITMKDESLFTLGGIWEEWQGLFTFSIITTQPNSLMESIHNRMPVILNKGQRKDWLLLKFNDENFKPYPSEFMDAYPVSTRMNYAGNNDSDLIKRI